MRSRIQIEMSAELLSVPEETDGGSKQCNSIKVYLQRNTFNDVDQGHQTSRLRNNSLIPKLLRGREQHKKPGKKSCLPRSHECWRDTAVWRRPCRKGARASLSLPPIYSQHFPLARLQPETPWEAPGLSGQKARFPRIVESEANGGQWKRSGLPILNIWR